MSRQGSPYPRSKQEKYILLSDIATLNTSHSPTTLLQSWRMADKNPNIHPNQRNH